MPVAYYIGMGARISRAAFPPSMYNYFWQTQFTTPW
jgi:hypothetical protein